MRHSHPALNALIWPLRHCLDAVAGLISVITQILGISRSSVYKLLRSGTSKSKRIGCLYRIQSAYLEDYLCLGYNSNDSFAELPDKGRWDIWLVAYKLKESAVMQYWTFTIHKENVSRTYPESNIGSVLSGKFSVLALEKGVEEKVK